MSLDTTKADDIALVIEEAIVSGELEPGTVLRQEQLSEQFNVSRTPIREALRRLAALGLVSFVPNRGVRVRTISREELHEAFMVRAELEALATEVAATKMTPEDLAELAEADQIFARISKDLRARERAPVVLRPGRVGAGRPLDRRPLREERRAAPRDPPGARRRQRRGLTRARARARPLLVPHARGGARAGRRHLAAAQARRR
jgi:Mn-dependent DtxR family transcriptional regulator